MLTGREARQDLDGAASGMVRQTVPLDPQYTRPELVGIPCPEKISNTWVEAVQR